MFHLHHPHGHHPLLAALACGLVFCSAFLTIADFSDADRRIAQAIVDALAAIRMTHKVACSLTGYKKSQWSKVLSCQLHISLNRLRRIGLEFDAEFMPRYLQAQADDYARQVVASAKERGRAHAA